MKYKIKQCLIISLLIFASINSLKAENILKILEGYGRDSIATFSARSGHSEAAKLFNLILESNGEVTAEKAEEYLSTANSNVVKAYLSVMLADYWFVNNAFDSGLRYLKRAVDNYDPIRNDSYYRSVLSRAQKNIKESQGKTLENKTTVLSEFNPGTIKKKPLATQISPPAPEPNSSDIEEPAKANVSSLSTTADLPNFRIQVGAFSVVDNVEKKKKFFEEQGYPVQIDERKRSSGFLYLIRVGAYSTYDQAKNALTELKAKYPNEEGIVIKVEK